VKVNRRREPRRLGGPTYSLCWRPQDGRMRSIEARGLDFSRSGIGLISSLPLPMTTVVFIRFGTLNGYGVVRHCTPHADGYAIGLELNEETKVMAPYADDADIDYYAFLQVNPKAEWSTINRVYRMMAARFHPDNTQTADPEKFLILQAACEVLSNPQRRAEYDASLQSRETGTLPIFELSEFVNGIEGEMNRRLGVLSLLYNRRRTSPDRPGVSLLDLEKRMGIPREYLEFTTWYLKNKDYIVVADNSDLTLTVLGVDFVESSCSKNPILQKLLDCGPRYVTSLNPPEGGDILDREKKPQLAGLIP